jgi:hypothetical protein
MKKPFQTDLRFDWKIVTITIVSGFGVWWLSPPADFPLVNFARLTFLAMMFFTRTASLATPICLPRPPLGVLGG